MSDRVKLSRLERYSLCNQLRILEALYPEEATSLATQREALERGYEILYSWDLEHIYSDGDTMSPEESKEVWDTMDMFDAIARAVKKYGPEVADGMPFTKFSGYDGNTESKFMAFAAFTVERLHRFEYVPMVKKGYWNSHSPMRDVYQRMLAEWQSKSALPDFDLTKERLHRILSAVYPGQR